MRLESLRVNPHRPYAFRSRAKIFLVFLLDSLGYLFFKTKTSSIPWGSVRRIAVLRLDHLGDVLMALPTLEALREALPKVQIDFWVGPWSQGAAEMAGQANRVVVFEAPWFSRPRKRGTWQGCKALSCLLREGKYDVVIDLRGDFRHILAMWMAKIPFRVGQTLTGGGFLLTHPVPHNHALHEVEQGLEILRRIGIEPKPKNPWPALNPSPENIEEASKIKKALGLQKPLVAVHAMASTPAKRWPEEKWAQLLDALPPTFDIVLVGGGADQAALEEIIRKCRRKAASTAGMMSLPVLAAFLKECRLFIGVDSGPAHMAAAVGTPVISLYSGTNLADQWAPRGPQVTVLQKKTPCSPCELRDCPIGNECMKKIEVNEIVEAAKNYLK